MARFSAAPMLTILTRELSKAVFSKTFVIVTFIIPAIVVSMIFLQYLSEKKQEAGAVEISNEYSIVVLSANEELLNTFVKAFEETSAQSWITLETAVLNDPQTQAYIEDNTAKILDGELSGIFVLPNSTDDYSNKKSRFYASRTNVNDLHTQMRELINQALLEVYLNTKISQQDRQFIQRNVRIDKFKLTQEEAAISSEKQTNGPYILAILMFLSTYVSILTYGGRLVGAVIEEKANRVVEIIISSMSTTEFAVGKILGVGAAALIQVSIWMIPVFYLFFNSDLPPGLRLDVEATIAVYFFINYVIAVLTYLGLYAAVGSMFDSVVKAQSAIGIVVAFLVGSMIACFIVANDPTTVISNILSMTPIASLIVMPVRMVLMDLPGWQIASALLVNLVTLAVVFINVGIVYRLSILVTGVNPGLREIFKIYRSAK